MTVSSFFKRPEATALPDKTAIEVAEFVFHSFTRHGRWIKITDQRREFVNKVPNKQQHLHVCYMKLFSKVNDELCRFTGVQCNLTSAYHPQSNGLDERFNQTLQRQLLKFVDSEQKK